jgi:broad specificity phosphatase PhoE
MYVVRHEKRPVEDPSFFVSLTEEGLSDSADAVRAKLLAANITKVYASPFRRVLQTVHPFLSESGLKAHVDWALYEHPEPNPEPITALPDDFHALFPIEKTYEPFVPGPAIAARNRDFDDVHARIREFVRKLSETHGEGDVLLLATHQTSVHSLLHQQSGIPMDCLNVPMGTVLELDWRAIVARGD